MRSTPMFSPRLRADTFSRLRLGMTFGLLALFLLPSLVLAAEVNLQPESREGLGPDRNYDIHHLKLELELDPAGGRVMGTATHRLGLIGKPVREIAFHQTGLEVSGVEVDGEAAAFRLTDTWLFVTVPDPAPETFEVRISYSARPTTGLHFRRVGAASSDSHLEVWSQGEDVDNRHWFPTWDHPSDRFEYDGIFIAPSELTLVSNGELVSRKDRRDGKSVTHWRLAGTDLVSYLVMVAAGRYERYAEEWQGREVSYFVPPGTGEEVTMHTVAETVPMLDFFSDITGVPYPYPNYKQIFVQRFIYGGMENTTATIMSDDLLHAPELAEHADDWTESVVAHELAHQWYGDQLTCGIWREMWLNEGFATYFAHLWMEKARGEDWGAAAMLRTYARVMRADGKGARPLLTRFYNEPGESRANPYSKGASVLQMLRVYLGDEVFFSGIQKYTRDHQHSAVETIDLRRAFEAVSGERLDWFFDQWVFLAGHPKISVNHRVDSESGDVFVTLRQTQKVEGLTPSFILPVELEIATSEGRRVEQVWLEEGETKLLLPVDGELLWLGVDPRLGLLAKIEQQQSPKAWLAQLAGSEFPGARFRALAALGERKGAPTEAMREQISALAENSAASLSIRRKAIEVVGGWRDEASSSFLVELLRSGEGMGPRLRDDALTALGKGPATGAVLAALDGAVRRDDNPYVRAAGLDSLAKLLGEGVLPRARRLLRTKTHKNVVEGKAAQLIGRHGSSSDLRLLLPFLDGATPRHMLHQAVWASAGLVKKAELGADRAKARDVVAPHLELLLSDLNLRTRQTAAYALRSAGNARSIQALQALTKRENFEPLARAAESAIESIRKRKDKAVEATPAEVEARLKTLEERLEKAEENLRKFEERR